jgi:hypothetical protein
MVSFPQASPPTPCAHLSPPPYAPHAQPSLAVIVVVIKDEKMCMKSERVRYLERPGLMRDTDSKMYL